MADIKNIKGNHNAKRVIEIALAGNFSVLLIGGRKSGRGMFKEVAKSLNGKSLFITAADKCKCNNRECICTEEELKEHYKYLISLWNKDYDIYVELQYPEYNQLKRKHEDNNKILERLKNVSNFESLEYDTSSDSLLKTYYERMNATPYDIKVIIKVARVIANMEQEEFIKPYHIAEAIQYRVFTPLQKL
jgi:magnesium chelatase family protein